MCNTYTKCFTPYFENNLPHNILTIHYPEAVKSLRTRLGVGARAYAAQDFRHSLQEENESVANFIQRLERTFVLAYGRDDLTQETTSHTKTWYWQPRMRKSVSLNFARGNNTCQTRVDSLHLDPNSLYLRSSAIRVVS